MVPAKRSKKKAKKKAKKATKVYEEYAFILDVSEDRKLAYALGDTYFRLLEVELKTPNDANLRIGQRFYIGRSKERDLIKHIKRRLTSGEKLTKDARFMAKDKTEQIILEALKNPRSELHNNLLLFFNHASPHSLRRICLSKTVANKLVLARDQRLKGEGKRFENFRNISTVLRYERVGITVFDLGAKIAERINAELGLIEPTHDKEPLLLRFLADPWKSISESHAEI
jgi:predicted nucleic acid-binding OB-fold protein